MALYAFDGTGDRWDDQKTEVTSITSVKNRLLPPRYLTNVVFFFDEYRKLGLQAEYFSGVGSSGFLVDIVFGGGLGVGAKLIADRAFNKLQKNFKDGDTDIDIVGYSRGAASARIFANKVFKRYKRIEDSNGKGLESPPEIRFIGLFDTVVSLGNPFDDSEHGFLYQFDHTLPEIVKNAYHAMALDLNRKAFGLDRIEQGNDVKIEEVWFRGGHGDIGGNSYLKLGFGENLPASRTHRLGPPNRLRSNLALVYMFRKAKLAGINFSEEVIRSYTENTNTKAPIVIGNNVLDRKAGSSPDRSRIPNEKNDYFHYSLFNIVNDKVQVIPASDFEESGYEFAKRLVTLTNLSRLKIEHD